MHKRLLSVFLICGVLFMQNSYAEQAIFAMGCFWCGESEFRNHDNHELLPGISNITVGYAGGTIKDPTYENHPGYKEALKIEFDPKVITYKKLLDIFWHNVDLFDANGQFCDQGFAYTADIFYSSPQQKTAAESSKIEMQKLFKKTIVTEVIATTTFYDAEDYHQNYAKKNPLRYNFYRSGCGRDSRLETIWEHK